MKIIGLLLTLSVSLGAFGGSRSSSYRGCMKSLIQISGRPGEVLNSGTVVYPIKRNEKNGFYALKAEELKGASISFCYLPEKINSENDQFAYYNFLLDELNPESPYMSLSADKKNFSDSSFAQNVTPPEGLPKTSVVKLKCEAANGSESEKVLLSEMRKKIVSLPALFSARSNPPIFGKTKLRLMQKNRETRKKMEREAAAKNFGEGSQTQAAHASIPSDAAPTGHSNQNLEMEEPHFESPDASEYITALQQCSGIPSLEKNESESEGKIRDLAPQSHRTLKVKDTNGVH